MLEYTSILACVKGIENRSLISESIAFFFSVICGLHSLPKSSTLVLSWGQLHFIAPCGSSDFQFHHHFVSITIEHCRGSRVGIYAMCTTFIRAIVLGMLNIETINDWLALVYEATIQVLAVHRWEFPYKLNCTCILCSVCVLTEQ